MSHIRGKARSQRTKLLAHKVAPCMATGNTTEEEGVVAVQARAGEV